MHELQPTSLTLRSSRSRRRRHWHPSRHDCQVSKIVGSSQSMRLYGPLQRLPRRQSDKRPEQRASGQPAPATSLSFRLIVVRKKPGNPGHQLSPPIIQRTTPPKLA
jgi:hypothetical protein